MFNKSTHDIAASFSRRGVLAATAGLVLGLASLTGAKAADDTIKVGGRYEPKDGKIAATESFVSQPRESAELHKENQAENISWYAAITADMFS